MRSRRRLAALVALASAPLWLPVTTVLGAASSPGPVPPDCASDPTIQAAGGEPTPGLAGAAPAGCLIQSWAATFSLSPHVLHVGQQVTATVSPTGKLPGTGWSWSNFTAEMQAGLRHHRHCGDNVTTCAVTVGPDVPEGQYQVYVQGLATPLGGAVSSDYFVVDNNLFQLSGRVEYQAAGTRTPAADVQVQVSGAHGGRQDASTDSSGTYSFVLNRGRYHVTVVGKEAQPSSRDVSLDSNLSGVDFLTGCVGAPTFQVVHVEQGGVTTFGYLGKSWDVSGCGPVTVTVAGEKGPIAELLRTYNTDDFKAVFHGKGRICGADFFARQQQSGRELKAGWTNGHSTAARVIFADPTLDSHGDELFPGDVLCEQEVGSQLAAINSGGQVDVSEIAKVLGLHLLEIAAPGGAFLGDAAGKVQVSGQSAQHSSEAASIIDELATGNPSKLSGSASGDTSVSGFAQSTGSYTVNGNLTLTNGVLLIGGDLTVTGTISGTGAVIATGNITAAGARLESDDQYGLIAGGSLNLP